MEYLDGQSLGRILHRDKHSQTRALPLDKMLFVFCELLEGLEYAHTLTDYDGTHLNIVHRDVSPENVFVTYSGQVKIVDFGIAKSLESNKTRVGVVKGKVAYMAPEQILGNETFDRRADLFAAGAVLWELLAGRPLFEGETLPIIAMEVIHKELPSLHQLRPDVPPSLDAVLARALAKEADDRFATGDQLSAALEEAVTPVSARVLAQWVTRLARHDLELREAIIARIEAAQRDRSEVYRELRGSVQEVGPVPDAERGARSAWRSSSPPPPAREEGASSAPPSGPRQPIPSVTAVSPRAPAESVTDVSRIGADSSSSLPTPQMLSMSPDFDVPFAPTAEMPIAPLACAERLPAESTPEGELPVITVPIEAARTSARSLVVGDVAVSGPGVLMVS
jgi:serine/threonine protein kinase